MASYVVRDVSDKTLVGIYEADTVMNLMVIVDENTDPGDCEFAKLPWGGLYWEGDKSVPVPLPGIDGTKVGDLDFEPMPIPGNPEVVGAWIDVLWFDETAWTKFSDLERDTSRYV